MAVAASLVVSLDELIFQRRKMKNTLRAIDDCLQQMTVELRRHWRAHSTRATQLTHDGQRTIIGAINTRWIFRSGLGGWLATE